MTDAPEVGGAVEAVKQGAVKYLTKPLDARRLHDVIEFAVTRVQPACGRPAAPSPGTAELIADCRRVHALDEGAMGHAHLAEKADAQGTIQYYAMKVIKSLARDERQEWLVTRFFRDIDVLAAFSHVNIVRFVD